MITILVHRGGGGGDGVNKSTKVMNFRPADYHHKTIVKGFVLL